MTRVLFYNDSTQWGGAERVLETLLHALSDDVEAYVLGVDAEVVARLAAARVCTVAETLPPARRKGDPRAVARLVRRLRAWQPDVFHVNLSWPFACWEAMLAAEVARGRNLVAHEHLPLPMRTWLHPYAKRALSRRVDQHVVVGEDARTDLREWAGLSADRLSVIPNGIRTDGSATPASRVDARPTVLGMGRFAPQKGFDVLVDAVALLPDVALLLVGARTEAEAAPVRARAATLGIADRVHVAPWSRDPDRWFGAADVFAMSSRFEAAPLTLLEAMAAGLPAVSTRVGNAAEVLGPIDPALVVPVDDAPALAHALGGVLVNPTRSASLGLQGRERVRAHYSATTMATEFERLYAALG